MRQLLIYLTCFILCYSSVAFSMEQWQTYLYGMDILDIAPEGDILWCTSVLNTPGEAPLYSVLRYDISSDTYEEYMPSDGISEDRARHIVIAPDGNIWCGRNGLSHYDGQMWRAYPDPDFYDIMTVDIGPDGSVWHGGWGVVRYDETDTVRYTESDGLPSDNIRRIFINSSFVVYAATDNGVAVNRVSTGVEGNVQPVEISLISKPNPFNTSTTISYTLPDDGHASLTIYNLAGQKVRTLVDRQYASGNHTVVWDGRDDGGNAVASGIYFSALASWEYRAQTKMLFLK